MNRNRLFRLGTACALGAALLLPASVGVRAQADSGWQSAPAAAGPMSFDAYVQLLSARALGEGVSEATVARATAGLTPNHRVIELDRAQPGLRPTPPPMSSYLRTHVDQARIQGGRRVLQAMAGSIPAIEARYGVPAKMLVAIFGHETNYGSYTGNFDLARSLATLAWEGRRRKLFEDEFIAVLKMLDQGVPPDRLKGSWAGAFGYPQFLPSVYLSTAQDGDGDGIRDIWTNRVDTLASIANYFRNAGWRNGEPWGVAASVPDGFDWSRAAPRLAAPSCDRVHQRHSVWKTVGEWRRLGVTALAPIREDVLATLFQPDGPGTRAFLLTGNYRVILQYNCSNYYALSVGLLADEIAR